jgi:hypothetical protein
MGAWGIFKVIAEKKKQQVKDFFSGDKPPEPADEGLPFNIFVGSTIAVSEIPFTIGGDNLSVKQPEGDNVVHAFSKTPIDSSIIYRFYVGVGSDAEHMIQIITDEKGTMEECRLFRTHAEVFPESQDEWDFWIGEEDGYIGLQQFQDRDGTLFERLWSGSDEPRVEPVRFTEIINLDRYARDSVAVEHEDMLYGRVAVEEPNMTLNEYRLLAFEDNQKYGSKIHIMGGIDLEKSYLTVNGMLIG